MKKQILLSLALFVSLVAQAQETVPQSQAVLKSYFVTGAVPTQNDFDEWIDTMFWYVNATYTNSLAAAQSAQQAASTKQFASLYLAFAASYNKTPYYQFLQTNGFASSATTFGSEQIGFYQTEYLWITNYFNSTNALYPPVFFRATRVPLSGGLVSTNWSEGTTSGSGYLGGPSMLAYVLTTNYFAVQLAGTYGTTNLFWFQFYQ
jgi:hypothetical protein